MYNKRGISSVVTTVLIILISITAIAIIGAFVLNFIRSNTEVLELGLNTINLEVTNNMVSEADGKAIVTVKRNTGSGNLSAIKFIFEKDDGSTYSQTVSADLKELEYKPFNVEIPNNIYITKVSVLPVVSLRNKERVGSSSSQPQERQNPPNLLTNGDFEQWQTSGCPIGSTECPTGYGFWTQNGYTTTVSKETNIKQSGISAAKLTVTGTGVTGTISGIYRTLTTGSTWILGQSYVVSSWVYCPIQGPTTTIYIQAQTIGSTPYPISSQIPCDNKWHYYTIKFTQPTATTNLYVGTLFNAQTPTYFIVDKAEVHKSI